MADKLKCLKHDMDPYLSTSKKFTPELKNKIRKSVDELDREKENRKRYFMPRLMTAMLTLLLISSTGWIIYNNYEATNGTGDNGDQPEVVTNNEGDKEDDGKNEKGEEELNDNTVAPFELESVTLGEDREQVSTSEPDDTHYDEKTGIETISYWLSTNKRFDISFYDDKVVGLAVYYSDPQTSNQTKENYMKDYGDPDEIREVSCYHTATCEEIIYKSETAEKVVRFSWDGNLEFITIKNIEIYRNSLSNEKILSIILDGHEHFWFAYLGGNDTDHTTFKYNDWEVEFDYFGEDLNTREKMIDYLDDVYSQRIIDFLFMKYDWILHNGILARAQTGLGSLTNWQDMKFINVERTSSKIVVTAEVPLGDTGKAIEEEVTLIFTEEKGWVLDTEIR